MTQEFVAKALGVSQAQYCRIEKGQSEIGVKKLNKLAEIFQVQPWEILNIWKPVNVTERTGIMKKLLNFITAPFRWVALGIRGGLAFILRSCFDCMVVYPKKKGKKNGK